MATLHVPVPVAVAGAALCVLGGFLVGAVTSNGTTRESTAQVASYDRDTRQLCLEGDAVKDLAAAQDGVLCGTWQRTQGAREPRKGQDFRFVTMTSRGDTATETATFIYGDVLR